MIDAGEAVARSTRMFLDVLDDFPEPAWARGATFDLRAHGLPHPVFGDFDGIPWILFAAAHTDNHLPQLRELRAHHGPSS